jgi:hypothetical protein
VIVLRVVAALYALSGLWCLFQSETAAAYVGYGASSSVAAAEFFTVYGGIQLGLGLAMWLGAKIERYQEATLFFAMVFSLVLVTARLISFVVYPNALDHMGAWVMAELEAVIAISLVIAHIKAGRREQSLHGSAI